MNCNNCGTFARDEDAVFCNNCGAELISPEKVLDKEAARISDDSAFLNQIQKHFGSQLFFVGFILFTLGSITSIVITFSPFTVISMWFTVIPMIGLWQIYNACNVSRPIPEAMRGILSGVKLLKIIMMIFHVIMWISVVLLAISAIISLFMSIAIFVSIAVVIFFLVLFIKFYYWAFFDIVRSVRKGLNDGCATTIDGAGSFTVLSIIGAAIGILFNAFSIFFGSVYRAAYVYFGDIFIDIADTVLFGTDMAAISVLGSVLSGVGLLLLVITLRKFAREVQRS